MKIKFLYLSLSLMLLSSWVKAQQAHYKDGDKALREIIQKRFSSEVKSHQIPGCFISTVIARFSIDTAGHVTDISFSENDSTPHVFDEILGKVILATDGSWIAEVADGKTVQSKPFILPLIIQLEAGCYNSHQKLQNVTDDALIKFFNTNSGMGENEVQLQCTILKNLILFSQN